MKKISPLFKTKCLGKVAHSTMLSAEYALQSIRAIGEVLEIYKCQFCKKFHIGHKVGTKNGILKRKFHLKKKIKYKLTEE